MRLLDATEQQGAGLVFVGNLNPSIFNPDWLLNREVITETEAKGASVSLICADVANFRTGDLLWEITTDKFSLLSEAEPFIRLADIGMELFAECLPETPLKAAGINWYHHFRLPSREHQIRLGRALAPPAPFGKWGQGLENDDLMKVGGLRTLSMLRHLPDIGYLDKTFKRTTSVTVEPSVKVSEGLGVFVAVNHHFQATAEETRAKVFADLINDQMNSCVNESLEIVSNIYDFGVSNGPIAKN